MSFPTSRYARTNVHVNYTTPTRASLRILYDSYETISYGRFLFARVELWHFLLQQWSRSGLIKRQRARPTARGFL